MRRFEFRISLRNRHGAFLEMNASCDKLEWYERPQAKASRPRGTALHRRAGPGSPVTIRPAVILSEKTGAHRRRNGLAGSGYAKEVSSNGKGYV